MATLRPLIFALLTACALSSVTAQAASPAKGASTAPSEATAVIDINTAGIADLVKLPSVGHKRAEAILKLRKRLGGFDRVEQLMRVRGIGRKTFRKMRPMVTVGQRSKRARK